MRIATIANAAVIHTRRWVEWFRARGHQVELWSLEDGPPELRAHRLPRAPLPGALRYPLAAPALARQLAGFRPDLVDAHYVPNYGLLATLAGARPRVVSAWGSDLLLDPGRDFLRRARARFVLRRADHIVADSDNLAAAALALGAEAARVTAIPWGVELERFTPGDAREPGLVLSTRMHEPIYDLPTVIRGLAVAMRARPELQLAIAGDGSRRAELEALARRELPEGRWRMLGRLEPAELAGWLRRAELYVAAARSDSTSLSLLEAMACGAIPVVTDLDGNRQWISDGQGGRLFPPGDPQRLAAGIEAAMARPDWRQSARAHNRKVIETRANAAVNMARIEALFELVAGASRGSAAHG
ncbi:MAG: glycosyltransferase [Candidatus Eiseniibacteriota bacterium]